MKLAGVSVVLLALSAAVNGARILAVVPTPTKSHHNLIDKLAVDLAGKGHRVTLITAFPQSKPVKNLEEVIYPNYYDSLMASFRGKNGSTDMFDLQFNPITSVFALHGMGLSMTDMFLSSPVIKKFIESGRVYDVVVGEAFFVEAALAGFSKKFSAPIVAVSTSIPSFWVNYMVGNPSPSSYIPTALLDYSERMTFFERLTNSVVETFSSVYLHVIYLPKQDALMRKHFGSHLPSLKDIITNTSLVLVNHHHSLAFPRPFLPNMIEVGGFHVPPLKPLPKDLKKYMDESVKGVILFSMGSHLKSSSMPRDKLLLFVKAFSRLDQNVLWKYEGDDLTDVIPPNVKIAKWLPQSDVLGHPNLKLFITHGGLLSTTEAIIRGVPLLGLPVFGDQPSNMRSIERAGVGKMLSIRDLTEEVLLEGIREVLQNASYKEKAKQRSVLLQDAPMSAIDTALYWIEYVIRHKGAFHLRSASLDLEWYQLYLVDVFAVFAAVLCGFLYLTHRIARFISGFVCPKKNTEGKKQDMKKKKKKTN